MSGGAFLGATMRMPVRGSTRASKIQLFHPQDALGRRSTRAYLRRQLLLERPMNASAIAVQLPGPPCFSICSRSNASSCGCVGGGRGSGEGNDVE